MTPRDVVVEDAPHYHRLGLVDLQVGGALGGTKHSAIAIGDPPSEYLARTRSPQLSSSVTLGYLRPFVFGDHPLHLGQQFRLRIVIDDRRVDESDRDTVSSQLVEHDDLIGVDAGEAVRRQAPHHFDETDLGRVPHGIEARTIQPRTRMPIVGELTDQLVALGADPFSKGGQLRADGAPLLLGLGGHSGVDRCSHWCASKMVGLFCVDALSTRE
jgi:hypothetical protein